MNKPAAKEPSMDEILSSIRQIIADDDTPEAPDPAATQEAPAVSADDLPSFDAFLADEETAAPEEPEAPDLPAGFDIPDEPEPEPEPFAAAEPPDAGMDADEALALSLDQVVDGDDGPSEADQEFVLSDDVAFVAAEGDAPSPAAFDRQAEPSFGTMPDPKLSDDLADHLLDSTAQAAASQAFSRLGGMSFGGGQTVEGVVREMLKPMLKSWLDENLPSIVERLVEREIERVSRGGR